MTNDKGIARIDDLPIGKYYLVETKTIDGFVLDDTPIEADLSYIDQNTKVVFAGMDVTNERQKVQITVTKTDSETKEALEGAVFGLFAKRSTAIAAASIRRLKDRPKQGNSWKNSADIRRNKPKGFVFL